VLLRYSAAVTRPKRNLACAPGRGGCDTPASQRVSSRVRAALACSRDCPGHLQIPPPGVIRSGPFRTHGARQRCTREGAGIDESEAGRKIAIHCCNTLALSAIRPLVGAQRSACWQRAQQFWTQLAGVVESCSAVGVFQVHISPCRKQGRDHLRIFLLRLEGWPRERALRCFRPVEISQGMDLQLAW